MNSISRTQNATILIVDDEDMVGTSLESLLRLETDHDVMRFTSPLLALESINETPIDLVISDYLMPEMDGADYSVPLTVAKMNSSLYKDTESHRFVSLFYGILNVEKKFFTYTSAGHNPQLLCRQQDGTAELLTAGGTLVGIMENTPFERDTVTLDTGDVLVLYTDGVTDSANRKGELFGEDRFLQLVKEHRSSGAQGLVDTIYSEITNFSASAPQFDDMTLIVLKMGF